MTVLTHPEQTDPLSQKPDLIERGRLDLFLQSAREHASHFEVVPCESGLELRRCGAADKTAARTFLKVCSVRPAHTVVFFFKRSLLPFSRDRYSYGGCEWPDSQMRPEHARASLDYLASGLSAAARPAWLRRSLPFSLPD